MHHFENEHDTTANKKQTIVWLFMVLFETYEESVLFVF